MPYRRRPTVQPVLHFRSKPILFLAVGVLCVALGGGTVFTASRLEERDAFCASCHSQPEATYFARETAAPDVDLASQHGHAAAARCIDCHSGAGVSGRLLAMNVGLHDLIPWVLGTARQPAPLTVPIIDENCLKCHGDVTQTRDFNRHFHAFLPRWQAVDRQAATCVDCHSAHTTDGEAALGFLQRQRASAVCQRCHAVAGEGS